jgi:hypothetical protein
MESFIFKNCCHDVDNRVFVWTKGKLDGANALLLSFFSHLARFFYCKNYFSDASSALFFKNIPVLDSLGDLFYGKTS